MQALTYALTHFSLPSLLQEKEVLGRIKASLDDPLSLEVAGYALFDMEAERRGNLFTDQVYRLTKAPDATTTVGESSDNSRRKGTKPAVGMVANHKFRPNDVILLTLQPGGSGDFFTTTTSPLSDAAVQIEARVLNLGPTYVDVATAAGSFATTLGPASNEEGGSRSRGQRLRVDRFFSDIPYQRMVAAVTQTSQIPELQAQTPKEATETGDAAAFSGIRMDPVLRQTVLATHALTDPASPLWGDAGVCDVDELARCIGKAPMPHSYKLAQQALQHIRARPAIFGPLNGPQMAAAEAALTRRLTLIQGPPGTGKTTVAAAIGFGMVHQCRSISAESSKVLACAFSNVGADNLAQGLVRVGLRVIRVGKASAVTPALWNATLDAAIDRDPDAQRALEEASRATAQLGKRKMDKYQERIVRQAATTAVKAAHAACMVAACRALRQADVIVSTSTGASDPRLLAACGILPDDQDDGALSKKQPFGSTSADKGPVDRFRAPDGLPPLSLPFVIVDEACQSVEPATLIPLVSSDSCRSLVLLGDPCQLPPTVRSDEDNTSPLSVSLMERLAGVLPPPIVRPQNDMTLKDTSYLATLAMNQCRSLLHSLERGDESGRLTSYRKRFAGSLLLSIQYRMHPSIAAFPSAIFYDGLLATPDSLATQRQFPMCLQELFPAKDKELAVRLLNVGGRSNERRGSLSSLTQTSFGSTGAIEEQTSYLNEAEAEQVVSLLKNILNAQDPAVKSIGIISPYTAQVQLLQSVIRDDAPLQNSLESQGIELEIKSVDGYQGRERDVIIFSAVRSNRQGKIGFLSDWRRMNVALTRAKAALLVVGDFETLSDTDKHWASFRKWAEGAGCLVEQCMGSAASSGE
jgi:hypothetical protein